MRLFLLLAILCSSPLSLAGKACTDAEFAKDTAKNLPAGSESLLLRVVQCDHLGEEVGYGDKERVQQINESLKESKCDTLDSDRAAFIKQHAKNKPLEDAFKAADSWQGTCGDPATANAKEKCVHSSCWGHKGCNYDVCTRADGTTYNKFTQ